MIKLRKYQYGTPRKKAEGLRVGVTRYPPRGVKKADCVSSNQFDVWLPAVAPSRKLLNWLKSYGNHPQLELKFKMFLDRYERELMSNAVSRQNVMLLAELAKRTLISIGCYCGDEHYCHRSRLYEIILRVAENGLPGIK